MHFQLNDSSANWAPGDVLAGAREATITSALTTLVGSDRAEQLIRRAGAVGLEHMDVSELAVTAGVPHTCAERVVAARALANAVRERKLSRGSRPEHLMAALPPSFGRLEREVILGLALNGANRVKAVVVLAVGGISSASLVPRDVFMPMVRHGAVAFGLAHNHPSGDKLPSREDIAFTNALACAGAMIGIPLVDHLVVAGDGFTSMYEAGLLLDETEIGHRSIASH